MSPTPRQRSARLTEQINRRRKEIERLEKQKAESKRTERNHRLIVSAATIEAVAHERGNAQFELDEKQARKIAEMYFDLVESKEPKREHRP